jgi:hypothetical protein
MVNIFLLFLWVFWPINMIKNIIKYKKIWIHPELF